MNARPGCALVLPLLLAPSIALADRESGPDTSYGRFDGDVAVALGAGVSAGPRGARAALDARLRYLSTAGVFVTYEDGPLLRSGAEPRRVLATGIELRPLFLARWAKSRETGIARLDLLIDSLALELGAAFVQPEGRPLFARPGLSAGVGLELPLLPRASGPLVGVHGGVRFSDAALSGGPVRGPSDRALYITLVLGWQQIFGAHVVDLGDRRTDPVR
jgi:hypothetical protein